MSSNTTRKHGMRGIIIFALLFGNTCVTHAAEPPLKKDEIEGRWKAVRVEWEGKREETFFEHHLILDRGKSTIIAKDEAYRDIFVLRRETYTIRSDQSPKEIDSFLSMNFLILRKK